MTVDDPLTNFALKAASTALTRLTMLHLEFLSDTRLNELPLELDDCKTYSATVFRHNLSSMK